MASFLVCLHKDHEHGRILTNNCKMKRPYITLKAKESWAGIAQSV